MRLFSLTGFAAVPACFAAAADEASPLAAGNQDAKAQTAGRVEPGDPAGGGPRHAIAADVPAVRSCLVAVRQVMAQLPSVRPCRVHGRKSRLTPASRRSRLAAIRQGLASHTIVTDVSAPTRRRRAPGGPAAGWRRVACGVGQLQARNRLETNRRKHAIGSLWLKRSPAFPKKPGF